MPGKQRGKMELPAGNANRRRFMCGGEAHGGSKRKKFAKGGAGKIAKDVATTAARSAYKAKTAPVQVASMLANKIAPGSKVAKGLKKAATPFNRGGKAKKRG
jgi:hypothetical protein